MPVSGSSRICGERTVTFQSPCYRSRCATDQILRRARNTVSKDGCQSRAARKVCDGTRNEACVRPVADRIYREPRRPVKSACTRSPVTEHVPLARSVEFRAGEKAGGAVVTTCDQCLAARQQRRGMTCAYSRLFSARIFRPGKTNRQKGPFAPQRNAKDFL
jgi:hypothetical protein